MKKLQVLGTGCPKCRKLAELTEAVEETIEVLAKTKGAFKSKELGAIRKKLEELVKKNNG